MRAVCGEDRRLDERARAARRLRASRSRAPRGRPRRPRAPDEPSDRTRQHHDARCESEEEGIDGRPSGRCRITIDAGSRRSRGRGREPGQARPERASARERRRGSRSVGLNARAADLQAPALDDQHGDDERDGKKDVLNAGQRRDDGEGEEHRLRPRSRPFEGDDAGEDCAQRDRQADCVGGDVGAEDERGESNRGRGREERVADGKGEPLAEEIDRHRGQRHRERVDALGDPVGDLGVVLQPGHCGQQRVDERREAGRAASDRHAARGRSSGRVRSRRTRPGSTAAWRRRTPPRARATKLPRTIAASATSGWAIDPCCGPRERAGVGCERVTVAPRGGNGRRARNLHAVGYRPVESPP